MQRASTCQLVGESPKATHLQSYAVIYVLASHRWQKKTSIRETNFNSSMHERLETTELELVKQGDN
jgi:hypothetical protein